MLIEVRLYATLRQYAPTTASAGMFPVQMPLGSTVGELVSVIKVDPAEIKLYMVNGASVEMEHVLHEGDRVGMFPPVGGG
jgi:molybdopterin converting factor small subunit